MFERFLEFVRSIYGTKEFIPLHAPVFVGNEKNYLTDTVDSTFVSSVGEYVNQFESSVVDYTDAGYAIATVNGTSALHIALLLAGVKPGNIVITQSFTFVATCNAIRYCGALPAFVDVDLTTLGLSAESLEIYLAAHCEVRDDGCCWSRVDNQVIRACVPMHTYGFPANISEIKTICDRYNITLVEDAAESLGSYSSGMHTGTIGKLAAISFNGNKIITTGGGGMILTADEGLAKKAKHITTTAKVPHSWVFDHDEIGYNYRLPNINAALGVAQMEYLPFFVENKRNLAKLYQQWGKENGLQFMTEPKGTESNYWLNAVITESQSQRDEMLEVTNANQVMTRPAWTPMHRLAMNADCSTSAELDNTEWLYERLVSVPSSVVLND
ncbi:MAG: LegC family aminotransferase [Gammaproteobacteria bacterium]|nr:LegC family aminotransferase [Gammaproteobacteria bacterium]